MWRCGTCRVPPTTIRTPCRASLTEAAAALAATLTEAGPDAQMWCPVDGGGSAFYARRFAYETAMHRADAALALGVEYALDPDVAADARRRVDGTRLSAFSFRGSPVDA